MVIHLFVFGSQEKNDERGSGSEAEKQDNNVPPTDPNEILPQISDEDSDDDRPRNELVFKNFFFLKIISGSNLYDIWGVEMLINYLNSILTKNEFKKCYMVILLKFFWLWESM